MWGAAVVMPAAPCFLSKNAMFRFARENTQRNPESGAPLSAPDSFSMQQLLDQEAAARGVRLRELRWKNSAWLATAETIAGWNGFEMRNAGSGRSPVRKRSG